jgi:hypothetical protein
VAVAAVVVPFPSTSVEGTAGNFEGAPMTSSMTTIMEGTQSLLPSLLFLSMTERGQSSSPRGDAATGKRHNRSKGRAGNIVGIIVVVLMGGRNS